MKPARALSYAVRALRGAADLVGQARRAEPQGVRELRLLGLMQAIAELDRRAVALRKELDAERRAAGAA